VLRGASLSSGVRPLTSFPRLPPVKCGFWSFVFLMFTALPRLFFSPKSVRLESLCGSLMRRDAPSSSWHCKAFILSAGAGGGGFGYVKSRAPVFFSCRTPLGLPLSREDFFFFPISKPGHDFNSSLAAAFQVMCCVRSQFRLLSLALPFFLGGCSFPPILDDPLLSNRQFRLVCLEGVLEVLQI